MVYSFNFNFKVSINKDLWPKSSQDPLRLLNKALTWAHKDLSKHIHSLDKLKAYP